MTYRKTAGAWTLAIVLALGGPAPCRHARAQGKPAKAGKQDPAPAADRVGEMRALVEKVLEEQKALRQRVHQLEQENRAQKERTQDQEMQLIRMQAEAEAATGGDVVGQADEEEDLSERVFKGGQRALQALNPEISVVGDAYAAAVFDEDGYVNESDRSGFFFRMVGLHFQADLDPFSFTKITVGLTPSGVSLGEAYMTWTSVLPGLSVTVGRFRQELGVVNRWHTPGMDQWDRPRAAVELLGPAGLVQTGLSVDWLMPALWAHANHLVLQVTNGENDRLFAGKHFSIPAVLLRLKSYYDLSESTYFELGLSGMLGWNNARGKPAADGSLEDEDWRPTYVWGADWTLVWEPLQRAKYAGVTARGELYGARKELAGDAVAQAVGLYQYVEGKVSRSFALGGRFDWTMPLAVDNEGQHTVAFQPYVTWWQSPWVRLRLHYAYAYSIDPRPGLPESDHRLVLQATFAAGPHKHERY